MKLYWQAILIAAVVLAGLPAAAGTNKVGVMKFDVGDGMSPTHGKFLSKNFTLGLLAGKQYKVVAWEEIDRVLSMIAKSQPNVSTEDARKMAINQLGLEKLFLGQLDKVGSKFYITVQLVGLNLEVERMERGVAESEEKLADTIDQMSAAFLVDNSDEAKALRAAQQAQAAAATAKAEMAKQETGAQRKAGATSATRQSPWTNSLGMPFVPVPGVEALFCIWDVRVQDFEAFVKATGYDATAGMISLGKDGWKQRGTTWRNPGFSQGPNYPVCGVSWADAKAFCRWLTERERSEGKLFDGQAYRLPRDGEWSAAVGLPEEGGGTPREKSGKIKDVYPWGTQWPPPAGAGNYAGEQDRDDSWPDGWPVITGYRDSYARTSPVGSFRANRFGLYDMGGNLWQWCEDWFDGEQKYRVWRGASWGRDVPGFLLSSFRLGFSPGSRRDGVGFRVVLGVGSAQ
jgi:formylglycine-generating enzyme required for sulfatase activity